MTRDLDDRGGLFHMDAATEGTGRFGLPDYDASTYGESFADVYDLWYEDLDDDDFVSELCTVLPPRRARILELGVGTGRLLGKIATARAGMDDEMTGIDASPRMLERAASRLGPSVRLILGDFAVGLPDDEFDLVAVGYNTLFNLPDEDALRSCMALVARRLAPDGSFSTDTTCPPPDTGTEPVSVRIVRAGEEYDSISRHDPDTQRITGRFVHRTDGAGTRIRPWAVRYWHPAQLDEVARRAGLTPVTHRAGAGGRTISHYRGATGNL